MLLALVSARETVPGEGDRLIAELPIGGRTIIERQVRLALDGGATRIVCLAERLHPALVALQHRVERAGASFILATGRVALAGAVTADDRLLVIADGLVLAREAIASLDIGRPSIFALPGDPAVAQGFERIDRERAWAGVMVLRGSLVERLNDLPEDMNCISSLLRLGLQNKTPVVMLEVDALQSAHLGLVAGDGDAAVWSRAEVSRALEPDSWYWPAQSLAKRAARWIAVRGLGFDRHLAVLGAAAAILVALSFTLAAVGHALPALVAAGAAAFALPCALGLATIRSDGNEGTKLRERLRFAGLLAVDAAIVAAIVIATPGYAREDAAFAALMLLGLLHMLPAIGSRYRIPLLPDRTILAWVLAAATGFGVFYQMLQILALAILVFGLTVLMRTRLTRA